MRTFAAIIIAALFAQACGAGRALAQDTGTLRVVLTDAKTKKPIALAPVDIYGSVNQRGVSGRNGVVVFTGLPAGSYDIEIEKDIRYYLTIHNGASVSASRTTTVSLSLKPTPPISSLPSPRPRVIALVHTTPSPPPFDANKATESSVAAELSSSMLDALGSLPGVTLQGSGANQTASIGGMDSNQTTLSIDGAPAAGFGSSPNVALLAGQLFDEVSVDDGAKTGSLGGTINADTRDPTLDWVGSLRAVESGYGGSQFMLTEGGTAGRVGVSATHAVGTAGDPLDGMRFYDSSGLDYIHNGDTTLRGDAFKVRYPFSQNNVLYASAVRLNSTASQVCHTFTGPIPCGYGPNYTTSDVLTTEQVRDAFDVGAVGGQLMLYSNVSTSSGTSATFGGVALPYDNDFQSHTAGVSLTGDVGVSPDRRWNYRFDDSTMRGFSFGNAAYEPPLLLSSHSADASVSAPVVEGRIFGITASAGVQAQNGVEVANEGLSLRYSASDRDSVNVGLSSNVQGRSTAESRDFSDAPSLTFNCDAHSAQGVGPYQSSSATRGSLASLMWMHDGSHISTQVEVRRRVLRSAAIYATVGAQAFDPSVFTPAYLDSVNGAARNVCGNTTPYGLADLYFSVTGIAPRAVYDTTRVSSRITVSRNVVANASVTLNSAQAYGSGGPLFSPWSTVAAGKQLPMTPYAQGNLDVKAILNKTGLTAEAQLKYLSGNNYPNVPAYATLDAGVLVPLQRGQITVSMLNITNEHPGPFATDEGAQPLPLANGGSYPTIAQPLQPRTFAVSFRLPIGRVAIPGVDAANIPMFLPFAMAGPRDPFQVNGESRFCGPEMLPEVRGFAQAMRAYVARIEAAKSARGYPATFPTASFQSLRFVYRQHESSYVVLIGIMRVKGMTEYALRNTLTRSIIGCEWTHMGTLSEARRVGLYVSPYNERKSVGVLWAYAPGEGIYSMPELIENAEPVYLPLPSTPPANPFALERSSVCPDRVRPAAAAVIAQLQSYIKDFYRGAAARAPNGVTAIPRTSAGGTWLLFEDFDLFVDIAPCFSLHGVTQAQLATLGLGGTSGDSIDYAPRLGFYRVVK